MFETNQCQHCANSATVYVHDVSTHAFLYLCEEHAREELVAVNRQVRSDPFDDMMREHLQHATDLLDQADRESVEAILIGALHGGDEGHRGAAAFALSFRNASVVLRSSLSQAVEDPSPFVRVNAALALWRPCGLTNAAVQHLIDCLCVKDRFPRLLAADFLRSIGTDAMLAVGPLCEASRDVDAVLRLKSVLALREIGKNAAAAIPFLTARLADNVVHVREAAGLAIAAIGCQSELLPVLLNSLAKETMGSVSAALADAIGSIGPTAVPALASQLMSDRAMVVRWSAKALGLIGEDAAPAVPALIRCLTCTDSLVRARAAEAVGLIGTDAPIVITALRRATWDNDSFVRTEAAIAIRRLRR